MGQANNLGISSDEFLLAVQRGRVQGAKIITKFGYNYAIGSDEPMQTIWEGSPANTGLYTYALKDSPSTVDILSTDAADDQIITIQGLDVEGYEASEDLTLNGTVPSTGTQVFSRVFRAFNNSDTEIVGDVEIYVSGSTLEENQVGFVSSVAQQSLFAGYTIPRGMTGYFFQCCVTTGKGKETRVGSFFREEGKVFRMKDLLVNYQNSLTRQGPYVELAEMTDIEIRAIADANNTNVSARFSILLLDNKRFG